MEEVSVTVACVCCRYTAYVSTWSGSSAILAGRIICGLCVDHEVPCCTVEKPCEFCRQSEVVSD